MSDMAILDDLLDAADEMIDATWGARRRIVALFRKEQRRSPDGWVYVAYRLVAKRVGIDERYADKLLKAMVADRVLLAGEPGAGSRPAARRINPRIDLWRGVPWTERDRELREFRLATALRAPERGKGYGSSPRSNGAARGDFVPRFHGAAPGFGVPRSGSRQDDGPLAAPYIAARDDDSTGPSPLLRRSTSSRSLSYEQKQQGDELIRAVEAKTGDVIDGPGLIARFERMVDHPRFDLDAIRVVIGEARAEDRSPRIATRLERWLDGTLPDRAAADGPAPISMKARRANLELRLRVAEQEGADDLVEDLQRQLAACETGDMEATG